MLAINANYTDIIVDIIQELLDFKAGSRAFFVQFRLQMTLSLKKEHLRPEHDLVSSVACACNVLAHVQDSGPA